MHSRDSSVQILDMSDFDELADFADLFTVPPTAKSPYSARPDSMAYPSGIPLELDMFDEDEGFRRYGVGRGKDSNVRLSGESPGLNPEGFFIGESHIIETRRTSTGYSRIIADGWQGLFTSPELDDLGDDLISPTLPSFDLTRRVSRDQTGSSDETGSTATGTSDSMVPIVFSAGDATSGGGSKEIVSRLTMTRKISGRPASLAATLRPRRASTGDWASLYDPQTPTAIVDLERMARGFPLVPRSVNEGDIVDGTDEVMEAKGMMGSLDLERFDSIANWQRQCCELELSLLVPPSFVKNLVSLLFPCADDPASNPNLAPEKGER